MVNQQGKSEYTKAGHTVDRWFFSGGAKVTVLQDCIRLTASENSPIYFAQLLEKALGAGVYTMAILLKNASKGALLASNEGHNTYYANKIFSNIGEDLKLVTATFEVPKNNTLKRAYVRIDEGSADLAAFKLEPGPYFTGWPVWNYALELAKCQRYQYYKSGLWKFLGIGICPGFINGKYELTMFVALPVTMRTNPVATFENLYVTGGVSRYKTHKVTGIRAVQDYIGGVELALQTDDTLEIGVPYYLAIKDTNGYFYLNANL